MSDSNRSAATPAATTTTVTEGVTEGRSLLDEAISVTMQNIVTVSVSM